MTPRPDMDWLAGLCALPGVSGDEALVRQRVWERLRPLAEQAWIDPLGSLVLTWCWRSGTGPRVVLAAHLDEVGLIVTGIDGDGLLRFESVGGVDARILPGCALRVGRSGIPGTVALPPVHLTPRQRREQASDPDDLRIDIGASDREQAERAVSPGDRAVFASPVGSLGRLFRAKALDDRAGVAAIVAALEGLPRPTFPLAVAFTVQEEIGTRGAAAVAEVLGADAAVILETTTAADLPGVVGRRRVTSLGAGPALTALDAGMIAGRSWTETLARTARDEGIPFQWKQAAAGGTDGAHFQGEAADVAVLSLPCRYLHAPCGVMDPADLEAEAWLLRAWLFRSPWKEMDRA